MDGFYKVEPPTSFSPKKPCRRQIHQFLQCPKRQVRASILALRGHSINEVVKINRSEPTVISLLCTSNSTHDIRMLCTMTYTSWGNGLHYRWGSQIPSEVLRQARPTLLTNTFEPALGNGRGANKRPGVKCCPPGKWLRWRDCDRATTLAVQVTIGPTHVIECASTRFREIRILRSLASLRRSVPKQYVWNE